MSTDGLVMLGFILLALVMAVTGKGG